MARLPVSQSTISFSRRQNIRIDMILNEPATVRAVNVSVNVWLHQLNYSRAYIYLDRYSFAACVAYLLSSRLVMTQILSLYRLNCGGSHSRYIIMVLLLPYFSKHFSARSLHVILRNNTVSPTKRFLCIWI